MSEYAGLTGSRPGRDTYQSVRDHQHGLRDHPPSTRHTKGHSAKLPHQLLQSLTRRGGGGVARRQTLRSTLTQESSLTSPPPIAAALEDAGLGGYKRKLIDELSCSTISQLLALDAAALDSLIEALRPLPGHRVRLLDFVERHRQKAVEARSEARGTSDADAPPISTREQRRSWQASAAQLRGKRGSEPSGLMDQPGQWSALPRRPAERKEAYVSSVRVLRVSQASARARAHARAFIADLTAACYRWARLA